MKRILYLCFLLVTAHSICRADISWSSPPVTLSSAIVDSSDPHVVIDSNGNATAIWLENGVINSSSQPFGGSWSASTTLSGSVASSPRIGVDASGNVTAIWLENGVVNSATLPFGGSWSSATAISGSGASSPEISVDSSGNVVGIWVRNGFIESATKLFGGSWSLVHMLSTNGAENSPKVSIGSNGKVVAVWGSVVGGNTIVVSATSLINGNWGASFNILSQTPAMRHNYPNVAVDANGNAIATWFRYSVNGSQFANVTLLTASLTSGSSTWTAIPIALDTSFGSRDPATLVNKICVDGAGNAIAMWTNSFDGETFNLLTAEQAFGGLWSTGGTPVLQNLYSYSADISLTSGGDAVITHMFWDGSNVLIQATEIDVRSTIPNFFSVPVNLSTTVGNNTPSVNSSVSGSTMYGATVWVSNNGSNNTIVASSGTASVLAGPTGLAVAQNVNNFGVFDEYFNTISWTPSIAPNIVQYNIYRNGIYFASVDAFTTQLDDHNAVQNGAVTYGVSAVNSEFDQSPIVTVNFP